MRLPVLACVLLSGFSPAMAETFTTADVARRSLQPNCLDWKVVGVCLWLHCKYGRCRINTTPRVRHYLPDLVFTAYDHTGSPPWKELRALLPLESVLKNLLQGGSFPSTETADGHSLRFKEVDAVGHPFPLRRKVFNVAYLCRSQAKPMFPYFISALDHAEWRGGLESTRPESLTPGLREIGDWPRHSWGSVFPRSGFVLQAEDAKAAAVVVQRAADIVTQPNQARVYVPFGYDGHRRVTHGNPDATNRESCERSGGSWDSNSPSPKPARCAPGAPLSECVIPGPPPSHTQPGRCRRQTQWAWLPPINERNARWQMISPRTQSHCETFGSPQDWSFDKTSRDGSYAWNLWRPYECCAPGKGKFIGHKTF